MNTIHNYRDIEQVDLSKYKLDHVPYSVRKFRSTCLMVIGAIFFTVVVSSLITLSILGNKGIISHHFKSSKWLMAIAGGGTLAYLCMSGFVYTSGRATDDRVHLAAERTALSTQNLTNPPPRSTVYYDKQRGAAFVLPNNSVLYKVILDDSSTLRRFYIWCMKRSLKNDQEWEDLVVSDNSGRPLVERVNLFLAN